MMLPSTQAKVLGVIRAHGGCTRRQIGHEVLHGDLGRALRALESMGEISHDIVLCPDTGKHVKRYFTEE